MVKEHWNYGSSGAISNQVICWEQVASENKISKIYRTRVENLNFEINTTRDAANISSQV